MTPLRQFLHFAGIGLCGTLVHYSLLITAVEGAGAPAPAAATAGFAAGAGINYVLNRQLTFRSKARHRTAAPRFLVVAAAGALANAWIVWLLSMQLRWHYLLAQAFATACVLVAGFVGHRQWTFRDPARRTRSGRTQAGKS